MPFMHGPKVTSNLMLLNPQAALVYEPSTHSLYCDRRIQPPVWEERAECEGFSTSRVLESGAPMLGRSEILLSLPL